MGRDLSGQDNFVSMHGMACCVLTKTALIEEVDIRVPSVRRESLRESAGELGLAEGYPSNGTGRIWPRPSGLELGHNYTATVRWGKRGPPASSAGKAVPGAENSVRSVSLDLAYSLVEDSRKMERSREDHRNRGDGRWEAPTQLPASLVPWGRTRAGRLLMNWRPALI